jgi:preprotein translocase subunit SecG
MKQKPSLVRQMWTIFASQIVLAICLTVSLLTPTLVLLHVQEKSNQDMARVLPHIHQNLQDEQDPAKLRLEATTFLNETVDEGVQREWALRYLVKISAVLGFGFFVYSFGLGICAYRLQRQRWEKDSSS